jgi:hypothetical protein
MQLVAGAKVAGKYELERRIGVGGMGEVWSAVQSPTRKRVALKFLKPAKEENTTEAEATRKRFLREARAACAVQHPNVVEIHDVLALDDGAPVMVMEFLSGETLEARLVRDGKMALGEIAAVLVRVVSAVGAAHALGIVHRDLKPDNIFLADTSDGVEIKVLDFGIAKLTALDGDAAQTGGLTNTGAMLGTPYYMSPEQAFGERNIDHRADVWSLGIILYRAITGVLPTRGDNIGQILKIIMMSQIEPIERLAPDLPADLVSLVARMLSAKREDRPDSLLEVKVVLERYAGVEVASFGAPAAAPEPRASHVSIDVRDASARTRGEIAAAVDGNASVGGVATGTPPSPAKKLPAALLGAGAIVVAAAIGLTLFAGSKPQPAEASSTPAASLDTPRAPESVAVPAASIAATPPVAPQGESAPNASASGSAKVAPAAPPSAPTPPPRTGPRVTASPPPDAPAPTAPPAPTGILTADPVF